MSKLACGLYPDEIIGKTALLEGEEIFERSPQPLLIFVRVQQDRHSIVERPDCFVAVSRITRIDRAPFGAFPPQPSPGEDWLPLHGDPTVVRFSQRAGTPRGRCRQGSVPRFRSRCRNGGARQPGLAAADGGFDQILFRLPQPGAAPFDKQGEWLQQPNANIRRHCRQKVDSSLTANAL